jgi:hypothetical protein
VDELPNRSVIGLQPTLGKFSHQTTYREIAALDPLQQPLTVRTRQRFRFVAAHLARRNASGLAQSLDPVDRRADADAELLGGLIARQSAALNRSNDPLPKLQWVRLSHPCWPPSQPAW